MAQVIEVRVEQDHLQRLVGSQPFRAVAELIWNAVDADAASVVVKVVETSLGGVEEVRVEDDGHGMTFQEAREEFSHLGGSWKQRAERSRGHKRFLHGSKGQGRWRAYAIGSRVRWISVAEDGEANGRTRVVIEGSRESLGRFTIGDPEPVDQATGTAVIVDCVTKNPEGLLSRHALNRLTAEFATYLEANAVDIFYRGTRLSPRDLKNHEQFYEIELEGVELGPAILRIVEWSQNVDRALYLCDDHGAVLERVRAGVQAPGFNFTAYLNWGGFRDHEHELALADWSDSIPNDLIEASRDKMRAHFRIRSSEITKELIKQWKDEDVYPYKDAPTTNIESAEKDLFDVVALAAAPTVNRNQDTASKRLTLSLLKEALNQSPRSLRRVLDQVLDLSDEKIEELDSLLRRTTLTTIITTAKSVADRLDFLKSLELLLFESESRKKLLERSQLHRIVVHEMWIFGEEYNLMGDDSSLTTVLKRHIGQLGRSDMAIDGPVRDERGKLKIIDLAMGRVLKLNQRRREHLVVEMKRPSKILGIDELGQIQRYATTVIADSRFDKTHVDWTFMLIGNEWDEHVEIQANQSNRPRGLIMDSQKGRVKVWVKTWSQLLEENEHRLKFIRDGLEIMPTDDQALEFLRSTHSKYLPVNVKEGEERSTADFVSKSESR